MNSSCYRYIPLTLYILHQSKKIFLKFWCYQLATLSSRGLTTVASTETEDGLFFIMIAASTCGARWPVEVERRHEERPSLRHLDYYVLYSDRTDCASMNGLSSVVPWLLGCWRWLIGPQVTLTHPLQRASLDIELRKRRARLYKKTFTPCSGKTGPSVISSYIYSNYRPR